VPVVHLIAAHLRLDATPEAVAHASAAATALEGAPGVDACVAGRSASRLVAAVWLADAAALEPFAASEAHMSFVMRGLAPAIVGMWSASIASERPAPADQPAALWPFAVPETEGVFEWQVRRELETIDGLPGTAWLGATVEERERYRAGGVVLLSEQEVAPFQEQAAAIAPGSLGIEAAFAPVLLEEQQAGEERAGETHG
jgi:hypothetical protein